MGDSDKINILIVDDTPQNLLSLEAILENDEVNIVKASSGNEALGVVLRHDFALVLLDVHMPDMDGFETAELMRSNAKTRHIPIIFVTAISKEQQHIFKGYEAGAVDYIFKPLDPDILINKVKIFIELFRQKKKIEDNNLALEISNRKILEQQKALIEEERIKVLFQMAGATAHELNQPLMALLGYIELLKMEGENPEKSLAYISKINEAGQRISDIVRKIRTFQHDETSVYSNQTTIVNLNQKIRILSVEDSAKDFDSYVLLFKSRDDIDLFQAKTISEAFRMLSEEHYDIIFLDYKLSDGNGIDFLRKMASRGHSTPVVVITGHGDEIIASNVIREGASDYLTKTVLSKESISRVITSTLEKSRLKKEVAIAMSRMAEMSIRDKLTGLYNRRYMQEVIEREFEHSQRYKLDLSCLILDLDFFKKINDTYGHLCGDFVLQEFANQLKKTTRKSDLLFRYGGEEFLVLLPQTAIAGALKRAEMIRKECCNHTYCFEQNHIGLTVSIGVASVREHRPENAADLISFADKALFESKNSGRDCVKRH
ncbi:MAG: diguanylate cyclase [Desulfobacterales bacterium]|nr:diguanylate cyclase [Desulfobacterales bacterium]